MSAPERRRWGRGRLIAVGLLLVPLVELVLLIVVGRTIGAGWTLLALLAFSVLGIVLLRREGPAAWRRLREAVHEGRSPSRELTDAALVVVGAALLVFPGFLTDVLGLLCLLPPTRPLPRRLVLALAGGSAAAARYGPPPGPRGGRGPDSGPGSADVIEGQVIDPDPDR